MSFSIVSLSKNSNSIKNPDLQLCFFLFQHDTSQDLLPNSLDYVNPKCIPNRLLYENDGRIQINNNLRRQQYENINQQTNEAPSPLLDDENGYLMSVMPKNSNMIPIDSYGYMEIEENNTKRDPSES